MKVISPKEAFRLGITLQNLKAMLIWGRISAGVLLEALNQVAEAFLWKEFVEEIDGWISYLNQYYKPYDQVDSEDRKALLEDVDKWIQESLKRL
ncbi:MAG TPA: hypothetical protein ENG61_02735 [Candidatus Korarchaeota archaeon]|nr:hypothetical protein [Candidatus Korarchaeota archaeon]